MSTEEAFAMPLRDHFRPPLVNRRSWGGFHAQWLAVMVIDLNRRLPEPYLAEPQVHPGSLIEIDVGTFEEAEAGFATADAGDEGGGVATAVWAPPRPTLEVETESPDLDEFEVRVFDTSEARRLVAAAELVSPSNKDRPEHRRAFVNKCASLLQEQVSVSIIDLVTVRASNLYCELLDRLDLADPSLTDPPPPIHAVSCRNARQRDGWRFRAWSHPLWLADNLAVPLDLEASYEETCRILRVP
jgi:hypothetical protein